MTQLKVAVKRDDGTVVLDGEAIVQNAKGVADYHALRRELAQLRVNQRQQFSRGRTVTTLRAGEDARDLVHVSKSAAKFWGEQTSHTPKPSQYNERARLHQRFA